MNQIKFIQLHIIVCLLSGLIPVARALETDRQQPVYIEADRVELDEKKGTSLYQGNVKFRQGSMIITAEKIMVYTQNGKLHKLLIQGEPAELQQKRDKSNFIVHSSANEMEYATKSEQLILRNNARVVDENGTIEGDLIKYNTLTGSGKAESETPDKRVHAIIKPPEPEKKEQPEAVPDKPAKNGAPQ